MKTISNDYEAFGYLIEMGEKIMRIQREGRTAAERNELYAVTTGADFIRQMSGCWHPDDRKLLFKNGWSERLDALMKETQREE